VRVQLAQDTAASAAHPKNSTKTWTLKSPSLSKATTIIKWRTFYVELRTT